MTTSDRSEPHARYALMRGALLGDGDSAKDNAYTLPRGLHEFPNWHLSIKVPVLPEDKQSFSELLKIS